MNTRSRTGSSKSGPVQSEAMQASVHQRVSSYSSCRRAAVLPSRMPPVRGTRCLGGSSGKGDDGHRRQQDGRSGDYPQSRRSDATPPSNPHAPTSPLLLTSAPANQAYLRRSELDRVRLDHLGPQSAVVGLVSTSCNLPLPKRVTSDNCQSRRELSSWIDGRCHGLQRRPSALG